MYMIMVLAVCQTATAQDYILLENLIMSHKELSNKLRDRVGVESAVYGTHIMLENTEKKYELLTDTLSKRMSSSLTDLNLLTDVARLTMDADEAVRGARMAYDKALDLALEHPVVLDRVIAANRGMADRIYEIYRMTAMVVTNGLRVSLGTPQQRHTYLRMVDNRIEWITHEFKNQFGLCVSIENSKLRGLGNYFPMSDDAIYRRAKRSIDNMNSKF